jgi:hypothetical protein
MVKAVQHIVFAIGFLCLLQHAVADNSAIAKQIEIKNSLLDDAQKEVVKLSKQIDDKEKENKLLEMDVKRFSQEVRRLGLDTNPNEATKRQLNTAQFEVKRAEFNLDKNAKTLKKLFAAREKSREQKRIYAVQIENLNDQLSNNKKDDKKIAANLQQQEAAAIAQERAALQAKLGVSTAATPVSTPAIAKPALPSAADKAKQEQAALAAKKAEQERLRLANIEKQKQLAAEKTKQEQADKERAALAAKKAEESALQAAALAEKTRLEKLAQEKLQAQAQAQAQAQEDKTPSTSLNQVIAQDGKATLPLTPQQQAQKKFIQKSATLPPAESALTLAMARSLDAASETPLLGNTPNLNVANPIGSNPKNVGQMKYLGNNQYMLELRVEKGKQQFILGDYRFVKNIPEHFDGIRCLVLVDARNKKNPTFQLVVSGG